MPGVITYLETRFNLSSCRYSFSACHFHAISCVVFSDGFVKERVYMLSSLALHVPGEPKHLSSWKDAALFDAVVASCARLLILQQEQRQILLQLKAAMAQEFVGDISAIL